MPHKPAAYDLCKHLDNNVRDRLLDPDTPNDVVDVARALMESHTPMWLFYYLSEVEAPENTGELLAQYVDDETIHATAERYADADGPVINFNNPASHNWMSDDPMAPARRDYQNKRDEITTTLQNAYEDAIGDNLPYFDDSDFLEWIADDLVDGLNFLQWAVWEQTAADRGAENPTRRVAEWHVQQTQPPQLVTAIATYETRDIDDHDVYLDTEQAYMEEYWYEDHLAGESERDDLPTMIVFLPGRDVPRNVLEARRSAMDDESQ